LRASSETQRGRFARHRLRCVVDSVHFAYFGARYVLARGLPLQVRRRGAAERHIIKVSSSMNIGPTLGMALTFCCCL
jgi:hypothetical protein